MDLRVVQPMRLMSNWPKSCHPSRAGFLSESVASARNSECSPLKPRDVGCVECANDRAEKSRVRVRAPRAFTWAPSPCLPRLLSLRSGSD